MVPLGIASAGRGPRRPRGRPPAIRTARRAPGWTAHRHRRRLHGDARRLVVPGRFRAADPRVHRRPGRRSTLGVALLFVAAVFQLFDGLQGVATGALRGLGDTRTPMMWNLAGHWFFGLPLGYLLCFRLGLGVVGLWWGLSAGLMICGVALLVVWIDADDRVYREALSARHEPGAASRLH